MKPTLSNIERRLATLEATPQAAPLEPLRIRVVYVEGWREDNPQPVPVKEWRETRSTHPQSGREIIVEWPIDSDAPAIP